MHLPRSPHGISSLNGAPATFTGIRPHAGSNVPQGTGVPESIGGSVGWGVDDAVGSEVGAADACGVAGGLAVLGGSLGAGAAGTS